MLGNILPPYHSLQELNLDWILTKVKNILRFVPDDGYVGQILRRTAHGAEWSNETAAPVQSVNGQTGAVILDAADVGALPSSYSPPVTSVNSETGDVVLDAADVGALPDDTKYAASYSVGGDAIKAISLPSGETDSNSTSTDFRATIAGVTELKTGVTVLIRNTKVASASGCTLNVNGLGAKPIYSSVSTSRVTTAWALNYEMLFRYDEDYVSGGCWVMNYGMAYSNTIGYQLRSNSYQLVMSDAAYRYRLFFTSADGKKFVPANSSSSTSAATSKTVNSRPIDPFGSIVYYSATTALSAGGSPSASSLWQQYLLTLGYSFNNTGSALTLTAKQPVYLRCAPQTDGSAIMEYFTQTLPSTEDGKIYIFLGVATSATQIELLYNHPVYYYKGSSLRIWTNPASGGGGAVDSVNGQTGTVVLGAADVGALPDTYTAPVSSVNSATGAVDLSGTRIALGAGDASVTSNGFLFYDPASKSIRIYLSARSTSNITTNTVLATIPDGYRPSENTLLVGFFYASGVNAAYFGTAQTSGNIVQQLGNTIREVFLIGEYSI